MAKSKPPEQPVHVLKPTEAEIAIDILTRISVVRRRRDNYQRMAERRNVGPYAQTKVRFVDQETAKEVYDIEAADLVAHCDRELEKLDAELRQFCRLAVLP